MLSLSQEDRTALCSCPLFHNLDPDPLLTLLNGQLITVPAGETLVHAGGRWTQVAVLLSGTLHACQFREGGQELLYRQLFPGYMAGAEIVCSPRQISPYDICAQKDCRLWAFPWSMLTDAASPLSPEQRLMLTQNLLYLVAGLNLHKYFKIESLSIRSARERILKFLTAQSLRAGSASFDIPMDREEMANYLCLNRSVLSHELKRMEADGLLRFRRNHFVLSEKCCHPALRERAGQK